MKLSVPFTRHPDFLVDENILPTLDSIEIRALWVLMRFSLGFDRLDTGPLSLATLGLKAGLSYRSAQRALGLLEGRGFIRRKLHPGQVSSYALTLPGVTLMEEGPGRFSSSGIGSRARGGGARKDVPTHARGGVTHDLERVRERESSYPEIQEDSVPSLQEAKNPVQERTGSETTVSEGILAPESSSKTDLQEGTGELDEIAEAVSRKLEGVSLRVVKPAEILPTLRSLKAESLNQSLKVDLKRLVLDKVDQGIEANLRKHGGSSTIHGWSYFVKGLPEVLEGKRQELERQSRFEQVRANQAEVDSALQRLEEEKTADLRTRWKTLDPEAQAAIERRVFSQLPGFVIQLVRRDREQGKRGSGLVALEHACLKELEARGAERENPGFPESPGHRWDVEPRMGISCVR